MAEASRLTEEHGKASIAWLAVDLLNHHDAVAVAADPLKVVAMAAPGAHEVHADVVDDGVEPREGIETATALEHPSVVLPGLYQRVKHHG